MALSPTRIALSTNGIYVLRNPLRLFTGSGSTGSKIYIVYILYYFGGFIAIGAITLFMNLSGESFSGAGIMLISAVYAAIGLKVTTIFSAKHFAIPAGISATFVVCLSPLTIWQKHEKAITQKSRLLLSTALSALLESTS